MTVASIDTVAGVRDRVRDAAARDAALRIVGRGTWLDAGRPVRATESISLESLAGITEYVPGDLTLTARAGTTLAEIRAATAEHGQWLALDPHGGDEGTLGATVATASAGPLFTAFGRPRDLVLGLEFVTSAGAIVRGGGRVVKNVAGFDLTRLLTGSWGTLGVITEVTVRLHARPAVDESVAIVLDSEGASGPERARQLLRRLPFVPYSFEVLNNALAERLLGTAAPTAIVCMGGNADLVRAQCTAFEALGDLRPVDPGIWQALRTAEPSGAAVFRLSCLPSEIGRAWTEALDVAQACPGTWIHASPARGVVRCIIPGELASSPGVANVFRRSAAVRAIGERLPVALWRQCTSSIGDPLSTRIKQSFDPRGVLNPGILGEVS